jgi:diguanylate cyclase (GGDEF)-like protein/PAS domain S-box-containing protein
VTPRPADHFRRNRWLFGGLLLFVTGVVLAVVGFMQHKLREQVVQNGSELAHADARSLEDLLTQNLKSTELMLQSLAQVDGSSGTVAPERMLAQLRSVPLLRSISHLDDNGRLGVSTNPRNVGVVLNGAAFVPVTVDPLPALRVGVPWRGRDFSDGSPWEAAVQESPVVDVGFVPLLRDVQMRSGSWVRFAVALNVDHLLSAYSSRMSEETHSVELLRYDGVLLLSTDPLRQPGSSQSGSEVTSRLAQREMGDIPETLQDGRRMLTSYRTSSAYPLVTVVRYDLDAVLAPWREAARTTWLLTAGLLALTLGLASVFFVWFERAALARWDADRDMRLASSVYVHAQEAITITDLEGHIVSVNDSFTRITGFTEDEVLGHNPRILSSGRQSAEFYADMWCALKEKGHWEGEIWNRRKSGEVYAEMLNIAMVPDEEGQPQNYVAIFMDITQQKNHHAELERIAHFDVLTGLPNRVLLADRLKQALAQAQRRGTLIAVVFLDLDGFKAINDDFGHGFGDQVLMALSTLLRDCLREGDTLARMGGDEFVAVLGELSEVKECEQVLERLLAAAASRLDIQGQVIQVSASIGASLYPQDGTEPDILLRHADQAMYEAKQAGKSRYQLFDVAQDIITRKRVESRIRLATALENREFVLHYQPKVNLRLGTVVGVEALVRWQDPQRGLVPPGLFLPDIAGHALNVALGDWVLGAALDHLAEWVRSGLHLPVSVNISADHLQSSQFVERLTEMLRARPNVPPALLMLEVLESSALDDMDRVSEIMAECQAMGVTFALDDFGTGYSSLTYLRRLPARELKIDQSFVRDMLDNADDLAIVRGVIGLARAFQREVIAEGVETRAHGDLLLHLGCVLAQGYGISRAMPAQQLPGWVQAWEHNPQWQVGEI